MGGGENPGGARPLQKIQGIIREKPKRKDAILKRDIITVIGVSDFLSLLNG